MMKNLSFFILYILLSKISSVKALNDNNAVGGKSLSKTLLKGTKSSFQKVRVQSWNVEDDDIRNKNGDQKSFSVTSETKQFDAKESHPNNSYGAKRLIKGPRFIEDMNNVSTPIGRDASIDCYIGNAEKYKIAWIKVSTQTILTMNDMVITRNHRISVERGQKGGEKEENGRQWRLLIRDVKKTDEGGYMCQINTDPMISRIGYLEVTTPPTINDFGTSGDPVVKEGDPVVLSCKAEGHPAPSITWKREDGKQISGQPSDSGTSISISKVTKKDAGAFLCIATNGIPPTISRRITLTVHYAPTVHINGQIVKAPIGERVHLNCTVKGSPTPEVSWSRNGKRIEVAEDNRHSTTNNVSEENDIITSSLEIIFVEATDDSVAYACNAKNSEGIARDALEIRVLEKVPSYESPYYTKTQTSLKQNPNNDYGFVDYEGMRDYEESNEDDNKMVHSTITNQKLSRRNKKGKMSKNKYRKASDGSGHWGVNGANRNLIGPTFILHEFTLQIALCNMISIFSMHYY